MSDQKVIIQGKVFNYGKMTDEQVLKLFTKIKNSELKLYKKINQAEAILKKYEDYN